MDNIRKGQVAILFVKHVFREKGIHFTPNFRREVGNEAKAIGVSFDEAIEFMELITRELFEEIFPTSNK